MTTTSYVGSLSVYNTTASVSTWDSAASTTSDWTAYTWIDASQIQGGTIIYSPPSGIEAKMVFNKGPKGIHPTLYFKYVKAKFTKMELDKLKRRVAKLRKMVVSSTVMDQHALMEQFSLMLAIAVRESEAVACGYDIWISKKRVEKFIHQIRDNVVKFKALENFPRLIPEKQQKIINRAKKKGLFDKYHILYMDPTKEEVKTTKEKIKEKDPIVFGTYDFNPDVLYYVCDWIDEHCDLPLEKFVEKVREDCPEFHLNSVPDMTDEEVKKLTEQVRIRYDRLKKTNSQNYKKLMEEEDKDRETLFGSLKSRAKKLLRDN